MIRQSDGVLLWEKMRSEKKTGHAVRVRTGQYETEENRWPVFLAKRATFRQIVKNVTNVRINILCLNIVLVYHAEQIRTERQRWKIANIV